MNYAQASHVNDVNQENSIYVSPQKFSKAYFQLNKLLINKESISKLNFCELCRSAQCPQAINFQTERELG
jgi:hypothetical protein